MKIKEDYRAEFINKEEYERHVKKSCDDFKKNTRYFKNRLIKKEKGEKKND